MKVAVSVPDPIFDAAERLARQRQVPRSQLFAEALQEYIARHGSAAVTEKLNQVYASEESALDEDLNLRLAKADSGLSRLSVVNVSQILTIDRSLLSKRVKSLPTQAMQRVNEGLRLALGL
jgi:metal-responsive CopG/Arc/MetJ family transcriptional regulator